MICDPIGKPPASYGHV